MLRGSKWSINLELIIQLWSTALLFFNLLINYIKRLVMADHHVTTDLGYYIFAHGHIL